MGLKEQYEGLRDSLLNDKAINKLNRDLFREFFLWLEEKLKRQNGLSKLDDGNYKTLGGYPNKFRNVNKWFKNKAWNKLTTQEIKQVYNDLEDGKIKNSNGEPFKDTRSYYNKIFKSKPFQMAGLRNNVDEALEFFTDKSKREVRFITEESFKRLDSVISKPEHHLLFWLMWDVGENINSQLKLTKKNFKKQINKDTKEVEYLVYLPDRILKRSRQARSEITLYPQTARYLDIVLEGKQEEDLIFSFGYRQALKIFDGAVKKSKVVCEPNGEKPSWKDLRSGMACHLFIQGWHAEDINLRLGHSPQSRQLNAYVNYLAINRKKAKKQLFINNLEEIQNELEESKRREKLQSQRMERQSSDIDELMQNQKIMQKRMITIGEGMRKDPIIAKRLKELEEELAK